MLKQELKKGLWVTELNGDMCGKGFYNIAADRLTENNWFIHLLEKNWVDWNDFMPCYLQACVNAGIDAITFITHY